MKVLLGVTGSVAAKLTPKMVKTLSESNQDLIVIVTKAALYFFQPEKVSAPVYQDKDEWPGETYNPDIPVLHIALRDWADILLITPVTYNTLTKMAVGIADNLLTCVVAAWDTEKPIIVAPAMNTKMWENPKTAENIEVLYNRYEKFTIIQPIEGELACGDRGVGAMAQIDEIIKVVNETI